MEESSSRPDCPRCGARTRAGACPACGHRPGGIELRVVAGGAGDGAPVPFEVPLVREYKGPTVREVLEAEDGALDLLPGRVQSMEDALRASDLGEAERRLDRAVGLLLRGPGHRRGPLPRTVLPLALWLWFAVLVGLLVWVAA